ncbi:MAG TPA: tetratricopeptide repeat protein [Vicinamibacteria bacterium]|nr:tetratricopeptide repeat protein [Vicinamibacteria bacterium]
MRALGVLGVALLLLPPPFARGAAGGAAAVREAEALAAQAEELVATKPQEALARARRALTVTEEFDPIVFVAAGRKGEVVEDEFVAARTEYRRHRAKLYAALGAALSSGSPAAASRYLRRAALLDPTAPRYLALARALLSLGRGAEAMAAVEKTVGLGGFPPEALPLVAQAADAAGWPSAQAEVDRVRLRALGLATVEWREGPAVFPERARLSTNPIFRLDDAPINVFYVAEASCRSCSEDVDTLRRAVPADVRMLAVPEVDGQDQALRQVLGLYRVSWPLLLGPGTAATLKVAPRSALVVARRGWSSAVVKPPLLPALTSVLAIMGHAGIAESVPRPAWNRRPVDRRLPPEPGLLPDGLAPAEDEPIPPELQAAVAAFRAGKPAEAQRLFEAVAAKGDGQLLPPEARLNRGLCLAARGQREAARVLLLRIGDSRFQEAVDRALEKVGSAGR